MIAIHSEIFEFYQADVSDDLGHFIFGISQAKKKKLKNPYKISWACKDVIIKNN